MQKTYGIMEWEDDEDFLEQYALKTGKLLKKGDPDINAVGRMILNDWYLVIELEFLFLFATLIFPGFAEKFLTLSVRLILKTLLKLVLKCRLFLRRKNGKVRDSILFLVLICKPR